MERIYVNEAPKCFKCKQGSVSVKFYGMPIEEFLDKIKGFIEIKLMGCVPPLIDPIEKTYLFKCLNCKYEWGDKLLIDSAYVFELSSGLSMGTVDEVEFISWAFPFTEYGAGNTILDVQIPEDTKIKNFVKMLIN